MDPIRAKRPARTGARAGSGRDRASIAVLASVGLLAIALSVDGFPHAADAEPKKDSAQGAKAPPPPDSQPSGTLSSEPTAEEQALPSPGPRVLEPVPELFAETEPTSPDLPVLEFSKEALDLYITFFPARSTLIGVGELDPVLGDYRKESLSSYLGSFKGFQARADSIRTEGLTEKGIVELESLRVHHRSIVRMLETVKAPLHDPNFYVDESVGALYAVLERDERSQQLRNEHLSARASIVPKFLTLARENLESCSKPAVRRAIMRLRGSEPMFHNTLGGDSARSAPSAGAKPGAGLAGIAWKAVAGFADWLQKEKLPTAPAPVPLGEAGWREWLRSREDTDLTPAQILAVARADLEGLKEEFGKTAAKISGDKTPAQTLTDVSSALLEPEAARKTAIARVGDAWTFMLRATLITPPSDQPITVRETPSFLRRDHPVRANLPGGYAKVDELTFLDISAPDPTWPPPLLNSWLSSYGKYFLPLAVMREVYPGRFAAWQQMRACGIRSGKSLDFPTLSEGWPLYAEEMMVRLGFEADDPRLKLAMLTDMIRADARLIASIRVHAMQASPTEEGAWLAKEGYWSSIEAALEMESILYDPDSAAPALGRLAIISLREDVKKAKGSKFSPREFHDKLLSFGEAPISALRRVMIVSGGGGPLLRAVR